MNKNSNNNEEDKKKNKNKKDKNKKGEYEFGKRTLRGFYKFIIWCVNKVLRVKVINEENLPHNKAVIITPNHVHKLDSLFLLNMYSDNIVFVAKEEMASNIIGKSMAWAFDIILINRDSVEITAMKKIFQALKDNKKVAIYPEGTRNGMLKGQNFKTGAVFLSLKANVNILPVGLNGSYRPFANDNRVVVGKEINFRKRLSSGETERNKEELERLTEELQNEVLDLIIDGRYDSLKQKQIEE